MGFAVDVTRGRLALRKALGLPNCYANGDEKDKRIGREIRKRIKGIKSLSHRRYQSFGISV